MASLLVGPGELAGAYGKITVELLCTGSELESRV